MGKLVPGGVPVWDSAGGRCGVKEGKSDADCPYHLLRPSWCSPHLGLFQRELAAPSQKNLEMNWCFSRVDEQGTGSNR